MFGKIVLMEILLSSFLFSMSATMVQNAPKEKLKCIKGLGIKRVQSIATYRQKNTINSLDELLNIKGIGKALLNNIKNDVQKKSCSISEKVFPLKEKKQRKSISAE